MPATSQLYNSYMTTIGPRLALYRTVAKHFNITRALYPGSHIDVTPSFVIPYVIYIDSFKGTISFFKDDISIQTLIDSNKEYSSESTFQFFGQDYTKTVPVSDIGLIISQYAGFVGQATKRYLRKGGILLANDSHGDATLAYLDDDFEFIGIVEQNRVKTTNLHSYFTFKRPRPIDMNKVLSTMKGPKYKLQPENYLFRYHPHND